MPHVLVVTPPHGAGVVSSPGTANDLPAVRAVGFTVEHCQHPEHLPRRLRLAPPSAIVLPLRPGAAPAAEATIREVRALCPEVPLVVYCLPTPDGTAVLAAARAGAEHFAFAPADDLSRVLRRVMAPAARASHARGLVESRLATFPALARALNMPTRTLRRTLARRGWPSPKTLLDAGRALRALLALADGEHPAVAASAAGFASARAVPRALRRLMTSGDLVTSGEQRVVRPLRAQLPRLLDVLERSLIIRGRPSGPAIVVSSV